MLFIKPYLFIRYQKNEYPACFFKKRYANYYSLDVGPTTFYVYRKYPKFRAVVFKGNESDKIWPISFLTVQQKINEKAEAWTFGGKSSVVLRTRSLLMSGDPTPKPEPYSNESLRAGRPQIKPALIDSRHKVRLPVRDRISRPR